MQGERSHGNEFDFIAWAAQQAGPPRRDVLVGPGDDCAVLARPGSDLLFKVDTVLEGVHFQRSHPDRLGYLTPEAIGRKVMARTISDVAAMGGAPKHALVMAALPKGAGSELREGLMRGLLEAAKPFGVALVGGDTKSWSGENARLALAVSLTGEMDGLKPVLRSGARAGDRIFVTGQLGGSILGKHAAFSARVAEGRWLAGFTHSKALAVTGMIDISDGLTGDLWQICRASGTGARLHAERIPVSEDARRLAKLEMHAAQGKPDALMQGWAGEPQTVIDHALHDGEDFELLFTVRAEAADVLKRAWPFATSTPLSEIGQMLPYRRDANHDGAERRVGTGLFLSIGDTDQPLKVKGYEHEL